MRGNFPEQGFLRLGIVSSVPSTFGGTGTPTAVNANETIAPSAPSYGFWVTYGAMGLLLMVIMLAILRGLRGWSLNDALSEDMRNGVFKASVSGLIALLGFAVIICIYLGTGCSIICRLLGGGGTTDLNGLGTILVGAAALFTPYLANQIKSAVIGVANGPASTTPSTTATVTSLSPRTISGAVVQEVSMTGSSLSQVQSAVCTLENGGESSISVANVNVLNSGAVEVTVTMPAPQVPGSPYQSTFTLVTNSGQRVVLGIRIWESFPVIRAPLANRSGASREYEQRIAFCADGIWGGSGNNTNVYKLFKALLTTADQVPYYDDGVGSDGQPIEKLTGGAFGAGLFQKIKDGYRKIAQVYEANDQLFLFGFSRN